MSYNYCYLNPGVCFGRQFQSSRGREELLDKAWSWEQAYLSALLKNIDKLCVARATVNFKVIKLSTKEVR